MNNEKRISSNDVKLFLVLLLLTACVFFPTVAIAAIHVCVCSSVVVSGHVDVLAFLACFSCLLCSASVSF